MADTTLQDQLTALRNEQTAVLAVVPDSQKPAIIQSYSNKINSVLNAIANVFSQDTAIKTVTTPATDTTTAIKDLQTFIYGSSTSFKPASATAPAPATSNTNPIFWFGIVFGILWISTILKRK